LVMKVKQSVHNDVVDGANFDLIFSWVR
jgi:hypothetical protein